MTDLVPSSNGTGNGNGNGNGHHPAASLAASEVARFQPGPKHRRYLDAVFKLLGEGGRLTNAAIAEAMVPATTAEAIRKWRTRHPEIDAWVDEQCRLEAEGCKGRVLMRATQLALRGSIDHMKFVAQVGGWFPGGDGEGQPPTNVFNVNLLVPRP